MAQQLEFVPSAVVERASVHDMVCVSLSLMWLCECLDTVLTLVACEQLRSVSAMLCVAPSAFAAARWSSRAHAN